MATQQPPQPPRPGAVVSPRASIVGGALGAAAVAAMAAALATTGIKPDEGLALTDYLDLAKVPTGCYGHTGADIHVGQKRTLAQCNALLAKDVGLEQRGVATCVPGLVSRPYPWAASTRLAHNIGVAAFCHSGAATHFNHGDWAGGCDLFLPWDKARVGGRLIAVSGLAARRQRERAQCLSAR